MAEEMKRNSQLAEPHNFWLKCKSGEEWIKKKPTNARTHHHQQQEEDENVQQ